VKILKYALPVFYVILIVFSCEKKAPTESEAPTPVITGIEPDTGYGGDIVIITGNYFNPDPHENIITFGGYNSTRAYDGTETTLMAIAPNVGGMEAVTIKVNVIRVDCTHWSNALDFTFPPIMSIFRDDFSNALGIEFDKDGNCYVSDADDWVIYKITPDGEKSVYSEVSGNGDMAFDRDGNLYVCTGGDWGSEIWEVPPGGGDAELFTDNEDLSPFGVDWDDNGNMYVAGHRTGIFLITPDGDVSMLDIDVDDAFSIAVFDNYVYWTDSRNNRVGRAPITADGVGATEIVYEDEDGTYMESPSGMAIDIEGNVYVVSKEWDGNQNLSRFRPDGTAEVITTLPTDNNRCMAFYGKYVYVTTQSYGTVYKVYVGVEGAPPYAWGP
jgi:hypothetical protein